MSTLDSSQTRKRKEGHFTGEQDTLLYYQRWLPKSASDEKQTLPTATLVITHGMAEHSDVYSRLVAGLEVPGLEIYAWDMRGHGHSEGRWGIVRSFDDFSKDLARFLSMIQEQRGHDGPIFLLGHSMGGLVTVNMLLNTAQQTRSQFKIAGLILSSPLFQVALKVPPLKEKAARLFAEYLPNFTVSNELNFDDLSRDRAIVKEYEKDPLRHDRISLQFYVSVTEMMEQTKGQADKLSLPLLMQLGGNDKVVSTRGGQLFFEKYAGEDKELIIYDEYYHEIYNDLGRERTYQDLSRWLKERT